MRRAEGGGNIFGVFRVKNHYFTPKNHIFSNCGGKRENCWGSSCDKSRFYAKKSYFFQMRRKTRKLLGYFVWKIMILRQKIILFPIIGGARRPPPPLDPPLCTMPTITFNYVSIKDRRVLMISLINHTSILCDAKVICKMALTTIVQYAVGGRLTKIHICRLWTNYNCKYRRIECFFYIISILHLWTIYLWVPGNLKVLQIFTMNNIIK
jgi:hypothetical protein